MFLSRETVLYEQLAAIQSSVAMWREPRGGARGSNSMEGLPNSGSRHRGPALHGDRVEVVRLIPYGPLNGPFRLAYACGSVDVPFGWLAACQHRQ